MLPGAWPPCRGAARRRGIYTHRRPGPGCRGPVKGASSGPRLRAPTQSAAWVWAVARGDLAPGLLLLSCGSSASVLSAGRALPRTSQPVLLPLVRFGESWTDQAHGEREGPRPPHSYTRVFPQLPRAFGGGPPALQALHGSIWEAQWDQRRGRRRVSMALGGPPPRPGWPSLHAPRWDRHLGLSGCPRGGPGLTPGASPPQGPSRNLLLNGKAYPTKVRLIRGGSLPPVKRRRMNWIDAPDDVFYMATEETRWGLQDQRRAGGRGHRVRVTRPRHSVSRSQEDPQAALVLRDQARGPQALQAHRPAPQPDPAAAAGPASARQRRAHRHRGLGSARLPARPSSRRPRPPATRPPPRRPVSVVPPRPPRPPLQRDCSSAPSGGGGEAPPNLLQGRRGVTFLACVYFLAGAELRGRPSARPATRACGPAGSFLVFC